MATNAAGNPRRERLPDVLSGTPRAHAIDRWIYVFMAVWFIAIVLVGFAIWVIGFFALGIWAIYRIARGRLQLKDRQPMPAS